MMPLLVETIFLFLVAFALGLATGATLWRRP